MAEDPLHDVIEGFRARLQAELDAQVRALSDNQAQTVERVRRETETEAEQRWASKIEDLRTEWTARLEQDIAAAREDAVRGTSADATRLRLEHEQEMAEHLGRLRREMEESFAAERRQSAEVIEAERVNAAHAVAQAVAQSASQSQAAVHEREQAEAALDAERAQVAEAAAKLQSAIEERQRAEQALEAERANRAQLTEQLQTALHEQEGTVAALGEARSSLESERADIVHSLETLRAELDAERRKAAETANERGSFDEERRRLERELDEARTAHAETRAFAAVPAQDLGSLIDALRDIDASASLSEALAAATRAASVAAPRATLFVVSGHQLEEWAVAGVPSLSPGSLSANSADAGLLADVLSRNEPVSSDGNGSPAKAPAFASLPSGRSAVGVPLIIGGRTVAVLYADEGQGASKSGWKESIEILGSHTAACLAYLTAARTAQAMHAIESRPAGSALRPASSDDNGARRYARLLLSEVKLYNEAAVRLGRQHRDLMTRLRPEIERARCMYEERISESTAGRDSYFRHELVQTLADGDEALLG